MTDKNERPAEGDPLKRALQEAMDEALGPPPVAAPTLCRMVLYTLSTGRGERAALVVRADGLTPDLALLFNSEDVTMQAAAALDVADRIEPAEEMPLYGVQPVVILRRVPFDAGGALGTWRWPPRGA